VWGRRAAVPADVLAALEPIFGDAVREVRIIERSLFTWLHGRAIATTRRRRILLRGSAADFYLNPQLMLHEYCHVLLQWESGELTTLRYVREWLRRGYWNNRFEVQAREFAQTHLQRFHSLLARAHSTDVSRAQPSSFSR
jgi:hypothetical protein